MNNAMGCTGMGAYSVLSHRGRSAVVILGEVNAMKFRSCLTLFAEVAPDENALVTFYQGKADGEKIRLLG